MVAIILVNYNNAEDTIDCIESISHITGSEYETIVIDNHSSDDSVPRLKSVQEKFAFVLLVADENNGFSAGNNIGIRYALAKGADFMLLLNNDTVVEPDFLQKLVSGFSTDSKCGLTIGKIKYYSDRNRIWYAGGSFSPITGKTTHYQYGEEDKGQHNQPAAVTFATGCCMCLSRDLIETVGLLNEEYFLYEEDAEYCVRINKYGFTMIYVPDSIIYHKVSSSTGQGSIVSQYYTVRNKFSMIRDNFNGAAKLTAYIYNILQISFRCIKGEMNYKYCKMAFNAFLRKEKGKVQLK